MVTFAKATKKKSKLRLALIGPAGSGKTWTALTLAAHLGERIALIDTEHGSASKYADQFNFDALELTSFNPQQYIDAIHAAEEAGYQVLIIDSLSHAWTGKGGCLELVDQVAARNRGGNSFGAWREVTPQHNALVDAILGAQLHVIATMRAKMDYAIEKDERGKTIVKKLGLAPVQRDGLEYEFDLVGDLDNENTLAVTKSRCSNLSGQVIRKPGKDMAEALAQWLDSGIVMPPTQPKAVTNGNGHNKPAPPKDGKELLARLQAKDAALAKEGLIRPGALIDHLNVVAHEEYACPGVSSWPIRPDAIEDLGKIVKEYEAALRAAPEPAPEEPTKDETPI